jgi:hypothetical protein
MRRAAAARARGRNYDDIPATRSRIKLSDEQLRALLLLAHSPKGCIEAVLMAHGFPTEMLVELLKTGLVKASPDEMRIARRRRRVLCFQITEVGRKAAADN